MITTAVALVTQVTPVLLFLYLFVYVLLFNCCFYLQSIMNRLWLKMSLKDAITSPIVFVDSKNNVNFEPGFDKVNKDVLSFSAKDIYSILCF